MNLNLKALFLNREFQINSPSTPIDVTMFRSGIIINQPP